MIQPRLHLWEISARKINNIIDNQSHHHHKHWYWCLEVHTQKDRRHVHLLGTVRGGGAVQQRGQYVEAVSSWDTARSSIRKGRQSMSFRGGEPSSNRPTKGYMEEADCVS